MKNVGEVLIVLALIAAIGGTIAMKNHGKRQEQAADPQTPSAASSEPLRSPARADGVPRLVDLGAGTCIPCKMMASILEELTEEFEGRLEIVFIDVRENPDEGRKYRINLIPTQIFFDAAGQELFRHEGFFSREDILSTWKRLGYDLAAQEVLNGSETPAGENESVAK